MLILLLVIESLVMCFLLLLPLVIGISNGAENLVVLYEKDVQERVIELGLTNKKKIKNSFNILLLVLYVPVLFLIPLMVCFINGARGFFEIFWQTALISFITQLFDRLFIDWYWVEHTQAWNIPNTEELKPYIPKKMKIIKWLGTIFGFAIIALIIALVMSNIV